MESDVKMIPILSYNVEPKDDIKEHENLIINPLPILKDNNLNTELIDLFKSNGLSINEDEVIFNYVITEDELLFNNEEVSLPIYKGELKDYLNDKGVLDSVKSINKLIGKDRYTNININDNLEELLKGEFYNDNSNLTYDYIIPSDDFMERDNPEIFTYYYFEVKDDYGNTYTLINDEFNKEQSKLIDTLLNVNKIKSDELRLSKSALNIYKLLKEFGYNSIFNIYGINGDTNKIENRDMKFPYTVFTSIDLRNELNGKEKLISAKCNNTIASGGYPPIIIDGNTIVPTFLSRLFKYTVRSKTSSNKMFYKFPIIDFKVYYSVWDNGNNLNNLNKYYTNNIYFKYTQSNFTNTDNTLYEIKLDSGEQQLAKPFDYSEYVDDYGDYRRYSNLIKVYKVNDNLDAFTLNEFKNGIIIGEDFSTYKYLKDVIKTKVTSGLYKVYQEVTIDIGNLNWETSPITIPMLKNYTKDNPYTMDTKVFY